MKEGAVPFIGISRHRIGVDGVGVTTLVAFHGCTLRCRYCLNSRCLGSANGLKFYIPNVGPISIDYGIPLTNPGDYGSRGGYFTFGTGMLDTYGY